jgi:2-phosphosulfolactate phosphatase
MNVEVALLPRDLDPVTLPSRAVVVFDVLRATTTMTAALAAGVREIRVFGDVAAVRAAAAGSAGGPVPLLCGEEQCLAPVGFDLGNSPGGFGATHRGRTVFMSTTNGTRALIAARDAKLLLAGAVVNASAVARVLVGAGLDVTLLCAGTNGRAAIEDVIGAGAVLAAVGRLTDVRPASDVARVALRLFEASAGDLRVALAQGDGGRNVIAAGLGEDVAFAAALDRFDVVGRVDGAVVTAI